MKVRSGSLNRKSLSLEPAVSRVLFRRFRRWWSFLWAARCRTARATNSGSGVGAGHAGEANLAIGLAISDRSCSRWGLPAPLVTEGAVRFYRTFSPVPDALRRLAVCSLLHFPSSHLDWPLASTLPCGARTFLDDRPKATAATTCPARARSATTIPPATVTGRPKRLATVRGEQRLPAPHGCGLLAASHVVLPRGPAAMVRGE